MRKNIIFVTIMSLLGCACASGISLANMNSESFIDEAAKGPSLMTELVALFSMALIPMFVILFSAFIKISIVSSLLRSAIGTQQAPANQVINGMSIIMSIYVLYPTFNEAYISIKGMEERMPATAFSRNSSIYVVKAINVAKEPFRKFLSKNSADSQKDIFLQLAYQSFSKDMPVGSDSFIILMPAFIMTQVRDGFVIGALIYMPFFVTDMLVSIILTALGMMMMAPLAIALPMKVFLIVFLNGWSLIITGLVKSFA